MAAISSSSAFVRPFIIARSSASNRSNSGETAPSASGTIRTSTWRRSSGCVSRTTKPRASSRPSSPVTLAGARPNSAPSCFGVSASPCARTSIALMSVGPRPRSAATVAWKNWLAAPNSPARHHGLDQLVSGRHGIRVNPDVSVRRMIYSFVHANERNPTTPSPPTTRQARPPSPALRPRRRLGRLAGHRDDDAPVQHRRPDRPGRPADAQLPSDARDGPRPGHPDGPHQHHHRPRPSLGTVWGLVRHWWVLLKFVASMLILLTAAFYENILVRRLAGAGFERTDDVGTRVELVVRMATALLDRGPRRCRRPSPRSPGAGPDQRSGLQQRVVERAGCPWGCAVMRLPS